MTSHCSFIGIIDFHLPLNDCLSDPDQSDSLKALVLAAQGEDDTSIYQQSLNLYMLLLRITQHESGTLGYEAAVTRLRCFFTESQDKFFRLSYYMLSPLGYERASQTCLAFVELMQQCLSLRDFYDDSCGVFETQCAEIDEAPVLHPWETGPLPWNAFDQK